MGERQKGEVEKGRKGDRECKEKMCLCFGDLGGGSQPDFPES